ncbi:diguanylate cyclase [Pseudothauera nasutitermitis]|uniref:diguanylate cyclase n=1 Tax=Pseudothauera nasutitermitis TaxID=2565930 RepID=A0A4S4B1S3_9RHOO|nr:diguanylate cyclase [Pseudothauera nasutitermitis]THF66511.1 diguanylate cyclase [Pseudothauera nasutitermitis]
MTNTFDSKRYEQLKASGDLPSPRGVALAIIRLTQHDEVSMVELARVIKSDPAFVGRLIKAANGIVALTRRPVVSVQEALMVLGLPAVRSMALGFSLLSNYRRGACRGFDYGLFWSRSLAMALATQVLAQRNRAGAPDELFSLGLLADVGRLALATLYPVEYGQVLVEARRFPELRLSDLEHRAFAMTHTELGAAMLSDWGVPKVLIEPVSLYETPERMSCAPGTRIHMLLNTLVLGGMVADLCQAPREGHAEIAARMIELGATIDLPPAELASAGEHIATLWLEWRGMLQLEPVDAPDFKALLEQGGGPQTLRMPQPVREEPAEEGSAAEEDEESAVRVLVVEDDAEVRAQLRAVLEEASYAVHEATDGHAGMESALELQPDVLLCDSAMPGMDGLELIRALRATRIGRNLYILLLTETEEDEGLIEAFEAGADDFIGKPLNPRVLAARMRAALRVVRLQQELEHDREEIRRFAAELAVSNRRLQEAALTDALTGFPNRRYAIERMQQEWQGSSRSGRPLSCMIIDIDEFKRINDTLGHDAGDAVLRAAADALRGALRGQDVICRTGGDEFLAICPDTELQSALVCGERLRHAVDGLTVRIGDKLIRVSISIGVAVREAAMADLDALIKRADQGAYRAKQLGRNRTEAVQLQHGRSDGR